MSDPRPLMQVPERSALLLFSEPDVKQDAELGMAWSDAGLTVRTVRGRKMRVVDAMFDEFAAALQFPYYFGENWPAFAECLSDLDWLPTIAGIVIVIYDAIELLADEADGELRVLVRLIDAARAAFSMPIESGEWWDRPAVPFHVVLHAQPADASTLRARWESAGASLTDFPAR